MDRKKQQFVVVRNGEHIAVCDTAEAAGRKLEEIKREDLDFYRAGWIKTSPEQTNYYILPR